MESEGEGLDLREDSQHCQEWRLEELVEDRRSHSDPEQVKRGKSGGLLQRGK